MRKSYRFLVVMMMSCLFTTTVFAQSVSVSGNVRNNSSQEVVPAVSVVVKGTSTGTFTNSDGDFSLNVTKLPVTLVFSSVGYENYEVTVTDASAKIQVDFKPNISLGQEVVVAANRTPTRILESPVTIERMSTNTIRNVAAPNFYDAISNLKGVDMHTASLTFKTPTTRGFLGSGNIRLNQLVDGMDNQAPGLNFSVGSIVGPNELDVDNVEMLAGASSALYGSGGMNGTLLINSKNPFKYQGFSFNVKQGIMHINDESGQKPSPYYDWSFRWAKAFKDKFAFKIAASFVTANDWAANDDRNKQQLGVLSKVVGGNRGNDPNYNGVNVYGDEASANMMQFAQLVMAQAPAALVQAANGYFGPLGAYPTNAQVGAFISAFPAAQQPSVQQFLPFYIGATKGYFGNSNVSRTGYDEKDLVDYNTINARFTAALHYKITPGIEASLSTNFGTGTTVYTGADRYSLRNLKMAQHKLEIRAKNWFLRGYTTQENAGGSYNATALGVYINSKWKSNQTWFGQYIGTFAETRRQAMANLSDAQIHTNARAAADQGRLMPGTAAYEAAVKEGRSVPISQGGALFLDKTDLWAGEGQLNLSEAGGFSDKVEVIVGANWKQYVLNSGGTLFADTAGNIKINEYGGYIQLRKSLFDDFLTLTAAGRYDKQTNFDGRFTPRFTAVLKVAKDNNIRFSYQTAYRFPTNQDQYISLITGAGTLIGCLPEFQTYYGLNSTSRPGYTAASIMEYRGTGDATKLVQAQFREVKPETVNSYEVGYKGILGGRLLVDAYAYYSVYKNFLATIGVGQSNIPNSPVGLLSSLTTTNVSYKQNADEDVKALGWGVGLEYQLPKAFNLYGNVFHDQLKDLAPGFVSFFNAPKYRFNIGLRNENVFRNVGFNVVAKWQDNSYYEGTFVSGELPYFTWVDAQITYRPAKSKSVFRVGGTNIGNSYYRTGFGSPYVGGLYYVSYGYNIF
ncbi:TonB-dependent receptor [Terrimonas sp. NA20]|uniref:TonB-dependent receptor n=1 Tax=Terrimonas ginsenosidimutans TaxID=2908004 RepID=A0ABS9KWD5_9BACT|nr:TonB-dependent receptor [Terrimonas ginsenosidimutans]MCG2616656.1 TonB-dependent receptor [Terrimonas ginsenosidimutans]